MDELISPKYLMKLIKSVNEAIWAEFGSYEQVKYYVSKWHEDNYDPNGYNNDFWENFKIVEKEQKKIDLIATLNSMPGSILLKVAIDLGVDTPDFIPSIPIFKKTLKSDYKTAYDTFSRAYKLIETDPGIAIGLANSALESIIKEILKDDKIKNKVSGGETLYKLTAIILKEFNLTNDEHPKEIKTIGNSLLSINQAIEKIRSEKTDFHGKTDDDCLITDTIYTYFVVNVVTTVGLFLNSYYKTMFPKTEKQQQQVIEEDDLPF